MTGQDNGGGRCEWGSLGLGVQWGRGGRGEAGPQHWDPRQGELDGLGTLSGRGRVTCFGCSQDGAPKRGALPGGGWVGGVEEPWTWGQGVQTHRPRDPEANGGEAEGWLGVRGNLELRKALTDA